MIDAVTPVAAATTGQDAWAAGRAAGAPARHPSVPNVAIFGFSPTIRYRVGQILWGEDGEDEGHN